MLRHHLPPRPRCYCVQLLGLCNDTPPLGLLETTTTSSTRSRSLAQSNGSGAHVAACAHSCVLYSALHIALSRTIANAIAETVLNTAASSACAANDRCAGSCVYSKSIQSSPPIQALVLHYRMNRLHYSAGPYFAAANFIFRPLSRPRPLVHFRCWTCIIIICTQPLKPSGHRLH